MKAATAHAVELFRKWLSDERRARRSQKKLSEAVGAVEGEDLLQYVEITDQILQKAQKSRD